MQRIRGVLADARPYLKGVCYDLAARKTASSAREPSTNQNTADVVMRPAITNTHAKKVILGVGLIVTPGNR